MSQDVIQKTYNFQIKERDCSLKARKWVMFRKVCQGKKDDLCKKRNKKSKQTTNKAAEYFDYAAFEEQAIAGLQSGAGLMGTEGVLTSLIQRLVNAALSGEMTGHLKSDKNLGLSNRRNGHLSKQLDTELGSVEIQTRYKRLGID